MRRLRLSLVFLPLITTISCITAAFPATTTPTDTLHHGTPQPISASIENPPIIGENVVAPGINPLTGQLFSDPAALNRLPILAKISNAPVIVRPQSGLSAADMVFEHYVEGGLTRFSALFYGEAPQRVGSIRSARLIDLELVPMFQALMAFSGASTGVEDRLNRSDFASRLFKGVLFNPPYFWRDETIEVPHNMFLDTQALWQLAALQGLDQPPELSGLTFSQSTPPGSSGVAGELDLRYRATRVIWRYNSISGLYDRWADGEIHRDANTLEQVTAANVVILYADHQLTDIVESQFQDVVSYSLEITLRGSGQAILFRNGQRYDERWVRPTREAMLTLETSEGKPLDLKPGKTWFQVVPLLGQQNPQEEWLRVGE